MYIFRRHWELKRFRKFGHDLKILHLIDLVRPDAYTCQFTQFTPVPTESEGAQHLHGEISGVLTTAPPHPELWAAASVPKTKQQLLLPHCAVVSSSQDSGCEWEQFTSQAAQGETWGQIKGSTELSARRPQTRKVKVRVWINS